MGPSITLVLECPITLIRSVRLLTDTPWRRIFMLLTWVTVIVTWVLAMALTVSSISGACNSSDWASRADALILEGIMLEVDGISSMLLKARLTGVKGLGMSGRLTD